LIIFVYHTDPTESTVNPLKTITAQPRRKSAAEQRVGGELRADMITYLQKTPDTTMSRGSEENSGPSPGPT
jgi:hypothetical protein